MHVGVLVRHLRPPLSGIGSYTIQVLNALAELPNRPQITIFHLGKADYHSKTTCPHVEFPLLGRIPMLWSLGEAVLYSSIDKHRIDILHDMTGLAPFMLRYHGLKTVITLYDLIPIDAPQYSAQMDRINYKWRLPYIVKHVDKVVTISNHAANQISNHFDLQDTKIRNISAGTDLKPASMDDMKRVRQKYNLPEQFILFLGAMVERKNIRGLLEAYQVARKQGFSLPLVLAGASNYRYKQIVEYIHELELAHHVVMANYIDDRDLAAIYTIAKVFVFPSFYEGFGLPVLDAMACGTPVITSNISSLPEVIGNTGILVDPHNTNTISDALHRVLASEVHQQRMYSIQDQASQFTWKKTASKLNQVYHEIMD